MVGKLCIEILKYRNIVRDHLNHEPTKPSMNGNILVIFTLLAGGVNVSFLFFAAESWGNFFMIICRSWSLVVSYFSKLVSHLKILKA